MPAFRGSIPLEGRWKRWASPPFVVRVSDAGNTNATLCIALAKRGQVPAVGAIAGGCFGWSRLR